MTPNELARVNKVLQWTRKHKSCLTYSMLDTMPRLMEMVYVPAGHVAIVLRNEYLRVPIDPSPPTTNTRGATPRNDQAQAADKGMPKKVDKGKGVLIKPEKLKKAVYSIRTGG
jgi:hypothetical protein